ncbi:MAG: DMT(drug/metabolite transporter) superfamily permease [Myxococcales bacterium]|nr:DMT(drug/metabolite transporter) superfamily permease [Myxococcales bacterium]
MTVEPRASPPRTGSLVAFNAYGWLVKATTPARLSTTAYVNPVVALILGGALLGERLTPRAFGWRRADLCAQTGLKME